MKIAYAEQLLLQTFFRFIIDFLTLLSDFRPKSTFMSNSAARWRIPEIHLARLRRAKSLVSTGLGQVVRILIAGVVLVAMDPHDGDWVSLALEIQD